MKGGSVPKPSPEKWAGVTAARKRFAGDVVPETAFAVGEYAERYGLSRKTASEQLRDLVRDGSLKSGMKLARGRWMCFYWIPGKKVG